MKSNLIISLFASLSLTVTVGVGGIGCSSSATTGGEVMTVDGTNVAKYVMSSLTLPKNSMTAAFDLDGDGTPDNRLGNIIQAVGALGLNPQTAADKSVMDGSLVALMAETSTDTTQQSAKNVGVVISVGMKAATAPNFDGKDSFTVDTTKPPGTFYGNITAGTFTSNNPAVTTKPVTMTISLPLVGGQPPLILPITAAYVTFKRDADGKISSGQVNGAIKKEDVDGNIIPAVAALLTAQIAADPTSTTLKMFDTNGDGTVTAAEVMSNGLISNFLAPDIQLFQDGVYKPNPAHTTKDSLSLGFSFTSAAATF